MWVEAGFPPNEALAYILTFGDFITGCALEHQAEIERRRLQPTDSTAELWKKIEAYPTLYTASMTRAGARSGAQRSSNFERGLRLLMTGLRLRHAELVAEREAAATEKPAARRKVGR
jgi:hypothetical protein